MKKIKIKIKASGAIPLIISIISERGEVVALCLAAALIHELGHLLAARVRGIEIDRIELGLMGARIVTEGRLCSYSSEVILALCGPFANICAVILSLLCARVMGIGGAELLYLGAEYIEGGGEVIGALGCFCLASVAQAAFNLLPVRSLDGGRIVCAWVSERFGSDSGERVVAVFTAIAVFCLWTAALYLMLRVGSGLAVFVFAACVFFGCVENRGDKF